jgi:ATP-dependent DNA helicase RecG
MDYYLDTEIGYLKGVGPKWGDILRQNGIYKILDLIEFFPRDYEDRRAQKKVDSLGQGDRAFIIGEVVKFQVLRRGFNKQYELIIKDNTGVLSCKFFRMPYRTYFEKFGVGKKVLAFGQVVIFQNKREFHHPELILIEELKGDEFVGLLPIYPEKADLNSKKIHKWILGAISFLEASNLKNKNILLGFEFLPDWILKKYQLKGRWQAIKEMHEPKIEEAESYFQFRSTAQRRFIFEDFFWVKLNLLIRKLKQKHQKAYSIQSKGLLAQKFEENLPFQLTEDQKKAFNEIQSDFISGQCMQRLLQGDVGCGKTAVIFKAIAFVAEAQLQSAIMVPTEILAEQHYKNALTTLGSLGVRIALLTSQTKNAEKQAILSDLLDDKLDLLIGTHSLIEENVTFSKLAFIIIDEQHRFGVGQRQKLKDKALAPHFLMVTATPIPRTLAMTSFGDLDLSFVKQKPPGRISIQTRVIVNDQRKSMLSFLFSQIKQGRQAYFIYPLVEESEKIPLKDVITAFESYKKEFPEIRWGLLHGQMKGDEKKQVMQKFKAGEFEVLLSTTVVEVGVDVPNANLIVIENAERFGLSQLHQLRGRVGRGIYKSFCVCVLSSKVSIQAKQRLMKLETTNDGFELAEWDLKLRGPGEFSGTRQSGLNSFNLAHIIRDFDIFEEAQKAVLELLQKDPQLKYSEHQQIRLLLDMKEKNLTN